MNINSNIFKALTLLILFGSLSHSGLAQDKFKDRIKDKVKSQKVAFITQKLDLTEEEAQKFWPVYNAYQSDVAALKASLDLNPRRDMSDKEAEDMMYAMLDGRSKEIDIQKRYIQKMKSAIPTRKIAMLFKVEREFREELISKIKEKRRNRVGN
ncbi:MAG: hypothetical protein IPO92_15275 [Saprospiraceae bacterium]|nr:hypothetical protein [Saprospiraceae bacterium]